MFLKRKKERNQIIDMAENLLFKVGFKGVLEDDLANASTPIEKQAVLVETLLYKYDYGDVDEKIGLLEKINKECRALSSLMEGEDKPVREVFDEMLKNTELKPLVRTVNVNGDEVKLKTFICGEYFDGKEYNNVVAAAIYFNDEALYENLPVEGVWSCASKYGDLKMVSVGKFDDPNDAFGYIDLMTGGKDEVNSILW